MTEQAIAVNRKAFHDYFIDDKFEAGIALTGTEIKSVRDRRVNLRDSYVAIRNGEAWLIGAHISRYDQGNRENHDPLRERKLLLHRREIMRLKARTQERNQTIVPLRMYLKNNLAKLEIAIVRGKRQYDKRDSIAKRESDRRIERAMKEY